MHYFKDDSGWVNRRIVGSCKNIDLWNKGYETYVYSSLLFF